MIKKIFYGLLVVGMVILLSSAVLAGEQDERSLPAGVEALKLDSPVQVSGSLDKVDRPSSAKQGSQQVLVQMLDDSVAEVYAKQLEDGKIDAEAQLEQLRKLKRSQDQVIGAALELDANLKVLGALQRLLNAVVLEIDTGVLNDLAAHADIASITPLVDYQLDENESVLHSGASAFQDMGYTGAGVSVAVLDTGIDYHHAALGGSGDPADYEANDPTIIEAGTFPTEKVIGGYDFVGGVWPSGDLAPDPDPLDDGPRRGHGTHVAGIIGGVEVPQSGIPAGVAPDVEFYALKVCSSVSSACSGLALMNAMEFVVDPNGDGILTDAVDIISMSFGGSYGNPYNDTLSLAVDQATAIGVLSVAPAGNAGDKPYIHDTPGSAPTALGVGATRAPAVVLTSPQASSVGEIANIPDVRYITSYSGRGPSPWLNYIKPEIGAPGAAISAAAGTGSGVSPFGGTSAAASYAAGSAALLKESLAQVVDPKNPYAPVIIKSLLVTNAKTNILDEGGILAADLAPITRIGGGEVRLDRALESPVALWVVGLDGSRFPHLSFGQVDVADDTVIIEKYVEVHNLTHHWQHYELSSSFRFAGDESNGAVRIDVYPKILDIPPESLGNKPEAHFIVRLTINGSRLDEWTMNSGQEGASGASLTANEFDGYVWLDDKRTPADDGTPIHMPWHVLPRLSGDIEADPQEVIIDSEYMGLPAGSVDLTNQGIGPGYVEAYSWIAHSPEIPELSAMKNPGDPADRRVIVDLKDIGVATYPAPAGLCSADDSFVMAVAITTYERYTHAVPNPIFDVLLDVDRDGIYDYDIFNFDLSLSQGISDGRSAVWVADIETGDKSAFFYLDHGTNSSNFVLTFCGEQVGLNKEDAFAPIDMLILANDWYYSGSVTDKTDVIEIAPFGERYLAVGDDIASGETETWYVLDYGTGNPTEAGILLLLDASRYGGKRGGALASNESLTLEVVSP